MLNLMEFKTDNGGRCAFNPNYIISWTQYGKTLEVQTRDLNDRLRAYSLHLDELDRVRELTVDPFDRVDPPAWYVVIIDFEFDFVLIEE